MARLFLLSLYCLTLAVRQSSSHFLLNYPPSIGFDDDLESTAPCGSFTVDFARDNVTDFHVDGSAIAMMSVHPEATWLFRATLDLNATGNWTSLLPIVQQSGLGDFCEPAVTAPSLWAGQKGVLGVVQHGPDGILYQCAAVNFVSGTQSPPSVCKNVTGLSATYTSDPVLSALPMSASSAGSTGTSSTGSTMSPTSTTTASTATHSSAARAVAPGYAVFGPMVWTVSVILATMAVILL